jgi:hypothetical protein
LKKKPIPLKRFVVLHTRSTASCEDHVADLDEDAL